MKLTEFLVRTKSSTLICRLPESFGFSSAFLGRAIMNYFDECYSVNKGNVGVDGWISAEMMLLEESLGGRMGL